MQSARAATETWSGNNTGFGLATGGYWSTTATNWDNNADAWVNGNDASYNPGAARNLVVDPTNGVTVNTLTDGIFPTGNNLLSLYGGKLTYTLASGAAFTNNYTAQFVSYNTIQLGATGGAAVTQSFAIFGSTYLSEGAIIDNGAAGTTFTIDGNATRTILMQGGITLTNGLTISSNFSTGNYVRLSGANTFPSLTLGVSATEVGGGGYTADQNLGGATTTVNFNNNNSVLRVAGNSTVIFGAGAHTLGTTSGTGVSLQPLTGSAVIVSSALTQGAGTFTKTGGGNLTLSGANTYTGNTSLGGGTTTLDYSTNNNSKIAGVLTLGGNTLNLSAGSFAQTVTSTTLASGASAINQTNSGTSTLALGAITRSAGGTLNIGSASVATTTNTNTNGILGGYATVGGANWAVAGTTGTATAITPLTTYTALATTGTDTNNSQQTDSATLTGAETTNSLKINTTTTGGSLAIGANSLTLSSGGLLFVGANNYTISSTTGTLTSGTATNSDLVINQYGAGSLTISAVIANGTGASTLTQSGTGTVVLSGTNTYTGSTYLNGGNTMVSSNANLGAQATGAALVLNGGTLENTATFGLFNGAAGTNNRAVTLGDNGGTFNTDATFTLTVAGVVSGTGGLVKTGAGTLTLSGSNTYTGGTTINAGQIIGGNLGSGLVTLNSSTGTAAIPTLQFTAATTLNNNIAVTGSSNFLSVNTGSTNPTSTLYGNLSGAGTLSVTNGFSPSLVLAGDASQFTGTLVLVNSSSIGGTGVQGLTGSNNSLTVDLNNANANFAKTSLVFNSVASNNGTGASTIVQWTAPVTATVQIGSLSTGTGTSAGAAAFLQSGNGTAGTTVTYQVGALNKNDVYAGTIRDNVNLTPGTGNVALTKVGTGSLTLSGTNTYTGATTVSNGALFVNGSLAAGSAVNPASGATVGGSGTINGLLTMVNGSTLSPGAAGANSIGALGVGALTLSSTTSLVFDLGTATTPGTTSDLVNVSGNFLLNGRLTVNGQTGFGAGSYELFTYGTLDPASALPTVASAPSGYTYSFDTSNSGAIFLNVMATPVPEPSTWVAGAFTLVMAGYGLRRRMARAQ